MGIYIFIIVSISLGLSLILLLFLYFRRSLKASTSEVAVLSKRLAQQELVASIYQSQNSFEETGGQIKNALLLLLISLKASRVMLMRYEQDSGNVCFLYERSDPELDLSPLVNNTYTHALGEIFFKSFISEGKAHLVFNDDGAAGNEKAFNNIIFKSLVFVPININGQFWGVLCAIQIKTPREWAESDIRLLKLAADPVAALIIREETGKQMNEVRAQAMQSDRARSYFLSRMNQEMRTPMNAIIGMTTIAKNSENWDIIVSYFDKINSASQYLLGTINSILDMSRIESGKFKINNSDFNIEKMLGRIAETIDFRIKEKNQEFIFRSDPEIPKFIISDEPRIFQVLINLLLNAIKFTDAGGIIILLVKMPVKKDNAITLRFEVIDSGIGLSKGQIDHLFSQFEQADGTVSHRYGGVGLGLAISKNIIELMGGKIWVESEIGAGTKFAFTIKLMRGSTTEYPYEALRQLRILAIDNDPYVLSHFEVISKHFNMICDTAEKYADAVKIMKQKNQYRFCFINDKINNMDGLKLIKTLRDISPGTDFVLVISPAGWIDAEAEAKKAGVTRFVSKPLFPSAIADVIKESMCLNTFRETGTPNLTGLYTGYRILIAEDVEINQEIISALLENTGIQIDFAMNGQEAVRIFSESPNKYDLIFMDVQMPEMDGYVATRAIRGLDLQKAKTIPIVAMTANVFKEDIEKCLESGMNSHVGKPLDIDDIISKLNFYLQVQG